jgi:hypothetical protein
MKISALLLTATISLSICTALGAQISPGQRPGDNAKGSSPMTPEPITLVLLAGTLGGGAYLARRRRRDS